MTSLVKKTFKNDISNTIILRLVTAALSFITTILIARYLTPTLRGEYVYVISIASLFVLGYLTIQHSIVSLSKKYSLNHLISNSLLIFIILTVLNELILYFFIHKKIGENINSDIILFLYFLFPLMYFQVLANTYYQILDRLIYFNVINLIYKLLLFISVFICLFIFKSLILILSVFLVINLLICLHLFWNILINIDIKIEFKVIIGILKASIIVHLTTISALILGEYNNYYIGTNLNLNELAFYDIATQISGIFILLGSSIVPIVFNRGMHLTKSNFNEFLRKALFFILLCSLLLIVFIFVFSDDIIVLTFGKNYLYASEILKHNIFLVILQIFSIVLFPLWILNNNLKMFSLISISNALIYFILLQIIPIQSSIDLIKILILINAELFIFNVIYAFKVLR